MTTSLRMVPDQLPDWTLADGDLAEDATPTDSSLTGR